MAVHFLDSADFESAVFLYVIAESQDIASTIITRINDVRNLTRKHSPTPRTVLYFDSLPHTNCVINNFLDNHPALLV